MIEQRLAKDTRGSTADSERLARELGALIRSYEKLADLDSYQGKAVKDRDNGRRTTRRTEAGTSANDDRKSQGDPDHWRKEIAQRIARLRQQWNT